VAGPVAASAAGAGLTAAGRFDRLLLMGRPQADGSEGAAIVGHFTPRELLGVIRAYPAGFFHRLCGCLRSISYWGGSGDPDGSKRPTPGTGVPPPETFPDALHRSRSEFEREARLATAAKLFETGRLSSGQAAGLLGMARVAFLAELGRLRVAAIQVGAEEFEGGPLCRRGRR